MMAPLFSSDAFNIIKFKIEQTVCDLELSKALNLEAKKQNRKIDVHIKSGYRHGKNRCIAIGYC